MAGQYYDKFFNHFVNDPFWKPRIKTIISGYKQKSPENNFEIKQKLSTIFQSTILTDDVSKGTYDLLKEKNPNAYIRRLLSAAYNGKDSKALKAIDSELFPPTKIPTKPPTKIPTKPPTKPPTLDLNAEIEYLRSEARRKDEQIMSLKEKNKNLGKDVKDYQDLKDKYSKLEQKYNDLKKENEELKNRNKPVLSPVNPLQEKYNNARSIVFCGLKPKVDLQIKHACIEYPFREEDIAEVFKDSSYTEVWYNSTQLRRWQTAVLFAKIKRWQPDIAFVGIMDCQLKEYGLEVVSK